MITGELKIPSLDGKEIRPGIFVIGEPTPIPGTTNLRALVDFHGALCLAELSVKFLAKETA